MSILEGFRTALQGLASNRMRSALTMLGVIIGVSAVILLVSIGQGAKAAVSEQISGLGSALVVVIPGEMDLGGGMPRISSMGLMQSKLTYTDAKAIDEEADSINGVTPSLTSDIMIKFRNKTRITVLQGVTPGYLEVYSTGTEKGRFIREHEVDNAKKVCILGQTVADDLFGNFDPVGKRVTLGGQKYTVIGVMKERGQLAIVDVDDAVFVPATSAMVLTGTDTLGRILVGAKDPHNVEKTVAEVKQILSKRHDETDFSVATQAEMLSLFESVMGILTSMLGGVAGISLLIGGIGIMNIMLVSVTERTREIGIRKAVGAKGRDILIQFLIEAAALSIMGGIIGLILSVGVCILAGRFLPIQITVWSVVIALAVAVAIGVFFGAYPARRASRLYPIVALRYE